jgi:hypothetical protein
MTGIRLLVAESILPITARHSTESAAELAKQDRDERALARPKGLLGNEI